MIRCTQVVPALLFPTQINHKPLDSSRSVTAELNWSSLSSPGSVVVSYEVTTKAPSTKLMRKANEQVIQNLNQTYKMDDSSFHAVNSSKWNITAFFPCLILFRNIKHVYYDVQTSKIILWHPLGRDSQFLGIVVSVYWSSMQSHSTWLMSQHTGE